MKCNKCHRHWKHVRNLDHVDSICPDCFIDPAEQLEALFEEILKRHVVLVELRDIYRHKLNALLNVQKRPI